MSSAGVGIEEGAGAIEVVGDAPVDGGGSVHPGNTDATDDDGDVEPVGESPQMRDRILVGGEGGDYVARCLSTAQDVQEAIRLVQVEGGWGGGSSSNTTASDHEPLLGLLGQLGLTRAETYRAVLDDSVETLLRKVASATMTQGALLSLLDASFKYVTIEELRAVPLAALTRLNPVPSSYLKNISRDPELFRRLPVETQRQCWSLKPTLLRRHATPIVVNFADETATVVRNLEADVFLAPLNRAEGWAVFPPGGAPIGAEEKSAGTPGGLPRKSLRAASASTARLRKIVGTSTGLYLTVLGVIRAHYAEYGLPATCALRSQLLMSLHDDDLVDLCAADKCHRLAWLCDACVRDRCLDGRRCFEMAAVVAQLDFDSRAGEREAQVKKENEQRRVKKEHAGKKEHAATNATRSKGLPALKVTFGMKKKPDVVTDAVPSHAMDVDGKQSNDVPVGNESGKNESTPLVAQTQPKLILKINPPAAPAVSTGVGGNDSPNFAVFRDGDAEGAVSEDAGAGSISRAEAGFTAGAHENRNPLAGVGMILRDPPMLHLLLHETCRTLEATVWNEMVPKKEERLKHLTSLLAVACGARVSTRADRPVLPQPPPAVMSEFYPILAEMILEAMLRAGRGDEEETEEEEVVVIDSKQKQTATDTMDEDGEVHTQDPGTQEPGPDSPATTSARTGTSPRIETLTRLMKSSDVIRKVALTHALRVLRNGDAAGSVAILTSASGGGVDDWTDEAPFLVTLARKVASMYGGAGGGAYGGGGGTTYGGSGGAKKVTTKHKPRKVGDKFWRAAVQGVLIPACVAGGEAHEEVLRLLLLVASSLDDAALCELVEQTLSVTKKSRKLFKKRTKHAGYEHEPPTGARGVVGRGGSFASRGSYGSQTFSNLHKKSFGSVGSLNSMGERQLDLRQLGHAGLSDNGTGADTDGYGTARDGQGGGVDGVRATYQLLAQRCASRLTPATAPRLHEYLARRDRKESKRNTHNDLDDVSGDFRTDSPALTG